MIAITGKTTFERHGRFKKTVSLLRALDAIRNVEMLLEAKKRAYKLAWHLRLFAFPAPDARGTTNCIGFAQLLRVSHTIVKVTP